MSIETELYMERHDPDYYVGMATPAIHDTQGAPIGWQARNADLSRWDDDGGNLLTYVDR